MVTSILEHLLINVKNHLRKEMFFVIYNKVINYCKENNLSVTAFEQKCGLPNGIVGKWNIHGFVPKIETVKKIVSATGIPIEKWID